MAFRKKLTSQGTILSWNHFFSFCLLPTFIHPLLVWRRDPSNPQTGKPPPPLLPSVSPHWLLTTHDQSIIAQGVRSDLWRLRSRHKVKPNGKKPENQGQVHGIANFLKWIPYWPNKKTLIYSSSLHGQKDYIHAYNFPVLGYQKNHRLSLGFFIA